jgi:RHS repeat-associated protein
VNETTAYGYDGENRLTGIQITTDNKTKELAFAYDPFGRRIKKTVSPSGGGSGEETTNYVYDGQNIILEYDQAGIITTRYTHGPNIDEPLSIEITGATAFTPYYYHADGLGSITALSNASGNIIQRYEYDSFGNQTITTNGNIKQPFTFTAREYDTETGMYFYRARYYDHKAGRFVTKDPIGLAGGDVNLYAYVKNNAINRIDPWGLSDLAFDRNSGTLTLFSNKGTLIAQWPAANNTTQSSNGPWPNGTYDFSNYNRHLESDLTGPYGANGIFIFDVLARSGMGVHSGRSGPASKTLGCVRTNEEAMGFLRGFHFYDDDPIKSITIK